MQKIQQDEPHTHDHRVNCRQYFFSSTCFPDFLPRPKHPQAKKDKKRKKKTDKHAKGKKRKKWRKWRRWKEEEPKEKAGTTDWVVCGHVCVCKINLLYMLYVYLLDVFHVFYIKFASSASVLACAAWQAEVGAETCVKRAEKSTVLSHQNMPLGDHFSLSGRKPLKREDVSKGARRGDFCLQFWLDSTL